MSVSFSLQLSFATCALLVADLAFAAPGPTPTPTSAAPATAPSAGKGKKAKGSACKADKERLCPGVSGREAQRACMLSHRDALAPACRTKIDKAEAEKRDCAADSEKFCSEVKPGHGRTMACLVGRKADVTPACRTHVDASIARFKAHKAKPKGKTTTP
jgi:hypothetical protein